MLLQTKSKIAVVAARGLGDGLLSQLLAHNFYLAGHQVVLFSTVLCQMANWFPNHEIAPFDALELSQFDHVFAADHSIIRKSDPKTTILFEHDFDRSKSMVDNLVLVAKNLGLKGSKETGLVPPSHLVFRKNCKRVILHPMSADEKKNWHSERFRALAVQLSRMGFAPVICVGPKEKEEWPEAQTFSTISDLAGYVYESGYLIGNDSGLGHLASLLQIPTLSLFARKSYSRLWRPGWAPGYVVTPTIPLLGASMKQRFWKNFLTVLRVKNNFKRLIKKS